MVVVVFFFLLKEAFSEVIHGKSSSTKGRKSQALFLRCGVVMVMVVICLSCTYSLSHTHTTVCVCVCVCVVRDPLLLPSAIGLCHWGGFTAANTSSLFSPSHQFFSFQFVCLFFCCCFFFFPHAHRHGVR